MLESAPTKFLNPSGPCGIKRNPKTCEDYFLGMWRDIWLLQHSCAHRLISAHVQMEVAKAPNLKSFPDALRTGAQLSFFRRSWVQIRIAEISTESIISCCFLRRNPVIVSTSTEENVLASPPIQMFETSRKLGK